VRALRGCPSRPPPIGRRDDINGDGSAADERDATNADRRDELSMTVGKHHRTGGDAQRSPRFFRVFTMP
jgi:hypothetical protein